MGKTSIVILTYNNLKESQLCLNSIRQYTSPDDYELIVVDNHSTDGTAEWLEEQKDIKVIFNSRNEGFPKGCNQGIAVAQPENDILLLNNDTIVTQQWLQNLRVCLYSAPSVGAVGPVTNSCSNYQAIDTKFEDMQDMQNFAAVFNTSNPPDYEYRQKLVGFCLLIKREAIDKTGCLDERFSPGNYEDDDYSYRLQEAGYRLLLCKSTFIYHFGSASFAKDIAAYQNRLAVNMKKFEEKWGFNPNYSSNIRHEIIAMIDKEVDAPIKVLEIGCACGATLLKIQNSYPNAQLFGIELNSSAAKIASHYCQISNENIENSHFNFEENFFDYIIFADVLEHLYNPYDILTTIRKYLKKDGYVLASIPNIMHYSIMADLFNGNFTYKDAGILDRTHVRFFTLNEIQRLFTSTGYCDMQYGSTVLSQDTNVKAFVDRLVAIGGEGKRNQFMAYQYIVRAKNRPETVKKQAASVEKIQDDKSGDLPMRLVCLLKQFENSNENEKNIRELSEFLASQSIMPETIKQAVEEYALNFAVQYNNLGLAYNYIGNKQRAAECFLDAYEKNPDSLQIISNIVSLLIECNEKDYARAILDRCDSQNEAVRALYEKL